MKKIDYKTMNAEEYVKSSINGKMLFEIQKELRMNTEECSIGWTFFDKPKFDKKLKKKVLKHYGVNIDLKPYWDMFSRYKSLYIQQDFMKKTYNHTFHLCGKFKDYGAIVFYGKHIKRNPNASKELVRNWFYNVVYENYWVELRRHLNSPFHFKKPFEYYIRWKPIAEAAVHFDKNLSIDDVKEYIVAIANDTVMELKSIDEQEMVFE